MFTVITMMRSGLTDRSSRVRSVVSVVTPARCYKDDNLTLVISITNTANTRTNCIVTRLVIRVYLGVDIHIHLCKSIFLLLSECLGMFGAKG